MPPERDIRQLLDDVVWRLRVAALTRAIAAGALAGTVAGLLPVWETRSVRVIVVGLVALSVAAALAAWRRSSLTRHSGARAIERQHPGLRNVVITAEELIARPGRASEWMHARVLGEASTRTSGLDAASIVDLRRPLLVLALVIAAAASALLLDPARIASSGVIRQGSSAGTDPTSDLDGQWRVAVGIQPPDYTGLPAREATDPAQLTIVEGTRLRLQVAGPREGVRMRVGPDALDVRTDGETFVADAVLRESGYLALESQAVGGERRLIPVTVTPDRRPAIRIEAPGRDLLLPPGASNVSIGALAQDDFGMEMLEIRYTKVSGSGEQFEFEEGTLPARLTRQSGRDWRAQAELPVAGLKLGPGDSVVYRAVARDARPGEAGFASSDTFFVEIQGRGSVVLEGIEMPPDEERYALSQQMIVQKIERLRAREKGMNAEAVRDEAALIAAEQRSVRANFIFLMGGHVEDEEEEAAHSHEIQEGRLENSARKEISTAIHHMTAAEQGLTAVVTGIALPAARAAVEALQRAFGRNRYLLRSLAVQSRIDPSRRLTGKLESASDWARSLDDPAEDPRAAATRGLLAALLRMAASLSDGTPVDPGRLAALAEQALAIDPASPAWQEVAQGVLAVRDALASNEPPGAVRARLQRAAAPVAAAVRAEARAPAVPGTRPASSLERAWADEVRR